MHIKRPTQRSSRTTVEPRPPAESPSQSPPPAPQPQREHFESAQLPSELANAEWQVSEVWEASPPAALPSVCLPSILRPTAAWFLRSETR